VIVIEDVHWADPSTVDLLSYAAARCGSMRVMIVATFRSSDLVRTGHPFLGLKLELQAHRLCQELELGPLSRVDVEKYIAAVFADNAFPADFAHSIYQRTEGSPLFVADLLRDLVHNEVVATVRGRWALARPLSELEGVLPESVRGMVERQISKLDARQRQLLEIAAVEGYEFSSAILARVAERDEAEIEEALDQIRQRHRLICSRGERNLPGSGLTSRYAFSHVLYQNALAAGLGPAKRISLSAAVAQAVRQGWSGHENEVAAQLAYLYERARDWRQAAEFFTLAARGASRLSGYREAIELSMRAMSVAGQLEGEPRLRGELAAQMQLAFARQARSEFSEAVKAYMSAAATAAELRDAGEQIEALCGAAFAAGYLKQTGKMHEYASHALDLAKGSGSPTGYPESVLAFCALFLGDLETADKQRHAVASLRETGPPSARIFAANSLALLLVMRSEYEEAERLVNESLVEMRSAHCWPDLLRASWFQGMALGNGGKVGEALSVLEKAKRLCELNGERFWYSRYPNTLGWLYGELADIDSAVRLNTEGIRAGEDADTPETIANSHINLANIYAGQGQFERAYKHICEGERVLERADHKHWLRWRFTIRLEIETANYFAAAGDAAQAGKLASSALARAEHARARKHVAVAHKLLGDAAMLRGRADESVREYDAALEVLKKYPCPLLKCKVLLAAWRACSVTGDRVRADRMLASYGKVVQLVAASIHDEQLRERFLQSKLVRSAGSAS
jgi:tetratricopeptide (TPR) repeat protein